MSNINDIYKKYRSTNDSKLFELIINLYLLECNYRKLFQIHSKNMKIIIKLVNIIKKSKYNYKIFEINNYYRLIVYNKAKFNIDNLDKTFSSKFAKQLGNFYACASNDFSSHDYQIMIHAQSINTGAPIYIQMCKKTMIIKNTSKILKIFDDIKKILSNLDDNLNVNIQINNN
jgi:hypothetical protein